MAIRFTANTDFLSRTTGLPAFGSMTASFWFMRVADTTNDETLWYWSSTSGFAAYYGMLIHSTGDWLTLDSTLGTLGTHGAALSLGTWYHAAVVFDDTANEINFYQDGALVSANTGQTGTFTPGYEHFGGIAGAVAFSGRMAALKTWTAVLTVAEIVQESRQYAPIRTANLHRVTPCLRHTDLVDYSGVTGVSWTANGTLATEDGPPIPWVQGRRRVLLPVGAAAGPTLSVSLEEPAIQISTF